jgi:hypothetical protein
MYNGYSNLTGFYSDMSTILSNPNGFRSRDRHVAIPLLILHAFDDPLSTWRTNAANDPDSPLYPLKLVQQEKMENLVVFLTEKGGHVGWPVGWLPHNWEFMNTIVAQGFVNAFVSASSICGTGNDEYDDILGNSDHNPTGRFSHSNKSRQSLCPGVVRWDNNNKNNSTSLGMQQLVGVEVDSSLFE